MPIKALFFDFDGVIQDSEPFHFQAWVETLRSLGYYDPSFIQKEVIGLSDLEIAERFIQRFLINETRDSLYEKKLYIYREIIKDKHFNTVEEKAILKELHCSFKLAIVSSSHSDDIEFFLKKYGMESYFSFIVGANHVFPHKPHPIPYLRALNLAQIDCNEALVIEDSDAGLSSANAANIASIWMNLHKTAPSPIQQLYPSCTCFSELPFLITNLNK